MKKSYTKLFVITIAMMFILSENSYAQPGSVIPANGNSQISAQGGLQKSLDSCGYNVNHYLMSKMTVAQYWYSNVGDLTTPNTGAFPARAQYYPAAGQDILISGVSFYAFIAGISSTTRVVTSIYAANADSTISTLLATDTIDVTGNTFSAYLPNIQFSSSFDTPVTVNSPYTLVVETMSNDSLALVSNSFANSDGGGEHLAQSYYAYPTDPSNDGFFKHGDFAGWDADFIIMPVIKTEVSNDAPFLLSEDTVCLGASITTNYTSQSPIFSNRFYSINHANTLENMGLHFGSDSTSAAAGTYTYPEAGTYDLVFVDTFELHGYINAPIQCMISDSFELVVLDTVITGDFVTNPSLGDHLQFNPATTSDSTWFVEWLFYDENDDFIESLNTLEAHYGHGGAGSFQVGMVLNNGCAQDTVFKTEMFSASIDEYDMKNISIYPNPSNSGVFQLKNLSNEIENITVMNALGQTVYANRPNGTVSTLDLSDQHTGVYFLTIAAENGEKLTKRLLITK